MSANAKTARGRLFPRSPTKYVTEELVAELGSAFLCADLGITPEPRKDHAAYLAA
jgi:antirestriction protein ArdC